MDSCKHCSDNSCAVEAGEFVGLHYITGGRNDKTELIRSSLFWSVFLYSYQQLFTLNCNMLFWSGFRYYDQQFVPLNSNSLVLSAVHC